MNNTVYLDGVLTDAEKVDPARCRFVGMWRPPSVPAPFGRELYMQGRFDVPQYIRVAPSNALSAWLDSESFYILMQAYRHSSLTNQFEVVSIFEEIKRAILERAIA